MNTFLTMLGASEPAQEQQQEQQQQQQQERQEEERSHPNLKLLDSLQLSYPGFERDKREAEAIYFGTGRLNLGFDAAIRRLRVKQRAHEEQRSNKPINRSHPNIVSLDALHLTYPGWKRDVEQAEKTHRKHPDCDFFSVLRRLQIKQLRHENDRSHYRLQEIDKLNLTYPGWKADIRSLEKFHFEEAFFLPGDSLFQNKIDSLKRRQTVYIRSQRIRGNKSILHQLAEEKEGLPEEDEEEERLPEEEERQPGEEEIGRKKEQQEQVKEAADVFDEQGEEDDKTSANLLTASECQEAEVQVSVFEPPRKSPLVNLLGLPKKKKETQIASPEMKNDSQPDEERTDQQPKRSLYRATGAENDDDLDSNTRIYAEEEEGPSSRTGEDAPSCGTSDHKAAIIVVHQEKSLFLPSPQRRRSIDACSSRPDPPEENAPIRHVATSVSSLPEENATRRTSDVSQNRKGRLDCDASSVRAATANKLSGNRLASVDPVALSPVGSASTSAQNQSTSCESKLSSYIDFELTPAELDAKARVIAEAYSEQRSGISDQPAASERHPTARHAPAYKSRNKPARARYCAPRLPSLTDDEQSRAWDEESEFAESVLSEAEHSRSSSQAVWDEQSASSATSAGAVWTQPSLHGTLETPSSVRAVMSLPERPPRPPSSSRRACDVSPKKSRSSRETRHVEGEDRSFSRSNKKSSSDRHHGRKSRRSFDEQSIKSKESGASSHGSTTSKKLGRCMICGDAKNHVFVPCGHLSCCKECASQVISRKMACPVCRGSVTEAIQVFL